MPGWPWYSLWAAQAPPEGDLVELSRDGKVSEVQAFLDYHETPEAEQGRRALAEASSAGHTDVVEALLQAGVDINSQDAQGRAAIHLAAPAGNTVVAMLLDRGADPDLVSEFEGTALGYTASQGNLEMIKLLLSKGADIDGTDKNGLYRPRPVRFPWLRKMRGPAAGKGRGRECGFQNGLDAFDERRLRTPR